MHPIAMRVSMQILVYIRNITQLSNTNITLGGFVIISSTMWKEGDMKWN